MGYGGRNESNSHVLAGIGEYKFFMNPTYIMSRKKDSNGFWAQEAEMSLIAMSLLESARRIFS